MNLDLQQKTTMTEAIYDELIEAVLKIVERLDLTSSKTSALEEDLGVRIKYSRHVLSYHNL